MKWSRQAEALLPDHEDRRSEDRFSVEGEVQFSFEDPVRRRITAQMLDYSKSGFRAIHNYPALESGQLVSFQHVLAAGEARVVWNRIAEGRTETGFVVLRIHDSV